MLCLRQRAMRLEKRKELKEYTWKATRSWATERPARQLLSVIRVLLGSLGFHVSPTNTAKVNREFTFIMPSSAAMWILVLEGDGILGIGQRS